MSSRPVCVIGNLNMDLIFRGVPELPGWGHGVEASSYLLASAGQGGYLALALGYLGVPVEIISNVGDDEWGAQIIQDLIAAGVGIEGVQTTRGVSTGLAAAIARRGDGERAFIGIPAHLDHFDGAQVQRNWDTVMRSAQLCLVGINDLPQFGPGGTLRVLREAHGAGLTTLLDTGHPGVWDPSFRDPVLESLQAVDYLVINEHEARGLAGVEEIDAACRFLQSAGGNTVIVKCGSQGSVASDGKRIVRCAARQVTVADAVGAGDTFNAGFLLALRAGHDLEACMECGTAVASYYIARSHDRFPTLSDLNPELVSSPAATERNA